MYYRYKVKKKKSGFLKPVCVLALVFVIGYAVYVNRQHLFFWKYTKNKIEEKIDNASEISDRTQKIKSLKIIAGMLRHYKSENPIMSSAFCLSGRVNHLLAEAYMRQNFSDLFIKGKVHDLPSEAEKYFLRSVRDFKKGIALLEGKDIKTEDAMMLAKAVFHTGYTGLTDLRMFVVKNVVTGDIKNIEDHRFYAAVLIYDKKSEDGLNYLSKFGAVDEGVQGLLFLSAARFYGEKYTNAIMSYKDILVRTKDKSVLKLVHINLGKIYYNQSLYSESLSHFNSALEIDDKDSLPKVWIGKNYAALGYRDRARAIWSEVLSSNGANVEVKELLDVM